MDSAWFAFVAVLALTAAPGLAAPTKGTSYFHTCRYRARYWDECVKTVAQELRTLFTDGVPELDVRPIDPLFVDAFSFSESSGKSRVNLHMSNVSMEGLKEYLVAGVRSNLQELSLEIRLRVPSLSFRSHYRMDGRFLFLSLSGGGTCRYNFTDVDMKVVVNGHLVRRVSDDALHFRAASLTWTMLPSKGAFRFYAPEGETSSYSTWTSQLLNEQGTESWHSFRLAAEVAFAEVLRERINRLMMHIPYRDLFPPGVLPLHLLEQPIADNVEDEYPPLYWTRPPQATTTTTTTMAPTTTTTTTTMAPTTTTTTSTTTPAPAPSTTTTTIAPTTTTAPTTITTSTTTPNPKTSTTMTVFTTAPARMEDDDATGDVLEGALLPSDVTKTAVATSEGGDQDHGGRGDSNLGETGSATAVHEDDTASGVAPGQDDTADGVSGGGGAIDTETPRDEAVSSDAVLEEEQDQPGGKAVQVDGADAGATVTQSSAGDDGEPHGEDIASGPSEATARASEELAGAGVTTAQEDVILGATATAAPEPAEGPNALLQESKDTSSTAVPQAGQASPEGVTVGVQDDGDTYPAVSEGAGRGAQAGDPGGPTAVGQQGGTDKDEAEEEHDADNASGGAGHAIEDGGTASKPAEEQETITKDGVGGAPRPQPEHQDGLDASKDNRISAFDTAFTLLDSTSTSPSSADQTRPTDAPTPASGTLTSEPIIVIGDLPPDRRTEYHVGDFVDTAEKGGVDPEHPAASHEPESSAPTEDTQQRPPSEAAADAPLDADLEEPESGPSSPGRADSAGPPPESSVPLGDTADSETAVDVTSATEADNSIPTGSDENDPLSNDALSNDALSNDALEAPLSRDERGATSSSAVASTDAATNGTGSASDDAAAGLALSALGEAVGQVAKEIIAEAAEVILEAWRGDTTTDSAPGEETPSAG